MNASTLPITMKNIYPRVILLFASTQNYFSLLFLSFANGSCECLNNLSEVNNKDIAEISLVYLYSYLLQRGTCPPGHCLPDPSNNNC